MRKAVKEKVLGYFASKYNCKPYMKLGWYKGECPYCAKLKFGIHPSKNRANCFSCGDFGTPIKLLMELEGLSTYPEAYNFLRSFEGLVFKEDTSQAEKRKEVNVQLPPSFKLMSLGKDMMARLARAYMKKRGFDDKYLTLLGIGYCSDGDYAGTIVFPFYRQSVLVYYIGRRFIAFGSNKFKNPNAEELGIGKSEIIYNEDALYIYNKVYIVESVINAITLGPNAIAIMGKKISDIQFSKISRSPCKIFIIALDPDALEQAIKLALRLVEKVKVKVIQFPEKEDVNSLGKKWVKDKEKETNYHTYMGLISLKNETVAEHTYN